MNLGILEIVLAGLAVAIVCVLVREHPYVLENGTIAFVLPADGTSRRAGMVVVQRILQRQVLYVGVPAAVQQRGRLSDTLVLHRRCIHDDGALHALADQRNVMAANGRERLLAQIVNTVGNQYEQSFRHSVGILDVCLLNSMKEALRIACLHHNYI